MSLTFPDFWTNLTFRKSYQLAIEALRIAAFNVFTSVGTLIGTVVDNFTSKIGGRNCYLIPLALIFIVLTIISIGLFLIPESPRYLVQKGKIRTSHTRRSYGFGPKVSILRLSYSEIETAASAERKN